MNYHVVPGKESEFKSAFEGVANALSEEEGQEKSNLYSDCIEPNKYLIILERSDQDACHAFIGSQAFRKVANFGASEIHIGRPTRKIY